VRNEEFSMPALKNKMAPVPVSRMKTRNIVNQTAGAVNILKIKVYKVAKPIDSAKHAAMRYLPLTTSPDWN
jgi:hypothetical protein